MKSSLIKRADAILQDLLELPEAEREEAARLACGNDGKLHALVASLLSDLDENDDPEHDRLRIDLEFRQLLDDPDQYIGQQIGNFRIEEPIGQGGMGMVFLARRHPAEFEQTVAAKILTRYGQMLAPDARHRFDFERQSLARLDHPNIARLIDGGLIEARLPYLIMEYVPGVPITEYCRAHELDLKQRLELFTAVGEALQHAHRKMILHRDIKPSNVLVDEQGRPRLLDFGVAQALDVSEAASERTSNWFTAGYLTPESLEGKPATVATDVFQLGVLLVELVTGRLPWKPEGNPPRPADHWRNGIPNVQKAASETGQPWARKLDRGFQAIIRRALALEPEDRYDSVGSLLEDLRAWTQCQPVQARGTGKLYLMHCFIRRRWAGVSAASLVLALLVAYAATVTVQRETIQQQAVALAAEAKNAEEILHFTQRMIAEANPAQLPDFTVREMLRRGADLAEETFIDRPEARISILIRLAQALQHTGASRESLEIADSTLDLLDARKHLRPDQAMQIQLVRARALTATGQWSDARKALEGAREYLAGIQNPSSTQRAQVVIATGDLHLALSDLEGLRQTNAEAAALDDVTELTDQQRIAILMQQSHATPSIDERIRLQREAVELLTDRHGASHVNVAMAQISLAASLGYAGDFPQAVALMEKAIPIQRNRYGYDHFARINSLVSYLYNLLFIGDLDTASEILTEAMEVQALQGDLVQSTRNLVLATGMGWYYLMSGEFKQSETVLQPAVSGMLQAFGDQHYVCLQMTSTLAAAKFYQGQVEESLDLIDRCDRRALEEHSSSDMTLKLADSQRARALLATGDPQGAFELAGKHLERIRGKPSDTTWLGYKLRATRGHAAMRLGKTTEAEQLLGEAIAGLSETLGPGHWLTRRFVAVANGETDPELLAAMAREPHQETRL